MKYQSWIYFGIGLFMIVACQHSKKKQKSEDKRIGMANPASVYCTQLRGKSLSVSTSQGVYTVCILPNGEQIEEWALFRRDHH